MESIVKLVLLAFFSLLLWTARPYPESSRLFPQLLGSVTIVLIIASLLMDLLRFKQSKKRDESIESEPTSGDIRKEKLKQAERENESALVEPGMMLLQAHERKKRLTQTFALLFISLIVGYLCGFLFIVPFYFITFGFLQGQREKRLKYIIIAVGITLTAYLFFTTLMGVPLLGGVLWN